MNDDAASRSQPHRPWPDRQTARRTLPLLLTLFLAVSASAQLLNIRTYDEDQGLPSAAVMGLGQAPDGKIWLATRNGLVCYDGVSWDVPDFEMPVTTQPVTALSFDETGAMWMSCPYEVPRIFVREEGAWRVVSLHSVEAGTVSIHAIVPGPLLEQDRIAALFSEQGQVFLVHGSDYLTLDLPAEAGGVGNGAWVGQSLLLACQGGLFQVRGLPRQPVVSRVASVPDGPIYAITVAPAGDVHLVGADWTGRLQDGLLRDRRSITGMAMGWLGTGTEALQDQDGTIFVGDVLRIYAIFPNRDQAMEINIRSGLAGNGCTDMLSDRSGTIWFSGMRGVSKLLDWRFAGYDRRYGLYDDEVSAVHERPDGTIILGHAGGLTVLDDPLRLIDFNAPDDYSARASDIIDDGRGGLWLALSNGGLAHLDADERLTFRHEDYGLQGRAIYSLLLEDDGSLLAGTGSELWRVRDGRAVEVALGDEEVVGWSGIRRLGRMQDGSIWVATANRGVFVLDERGVRQYSSPRPRYRNTYAVFDGAEAVWVATTAGLAELSPEGIVPVRDGGPFIDRPIYAITAGADGGVWFGTDLGVKVWDGRSLATYDVNDGLVGQEVNRDALTLDSRGRLWIGTDRGVSVQEGARTERSVFEPPAQIESIVAEGVVMPLDQGLTIPAETTELIFHFRSIPFRDERELRFRIWLEGFDDGWSEPRAYPLHSVRYTSLPPGRYRFHVQAENAEGVSGQAATTQEIVVTPPWYQRPLSIIIEVVLALALMSLLVSWWTNRRYARRLAGEVDDRTRDLATSERAVRRESERLSTVLASISDAVMVTDDEGRIAMGNVALEALTGTPLAELTGRSLQVVFPGLAEAMDPTAVAGADGSGLSVFGYRFQVSLEETRFIEVSVAPLADAGQGRRVYALRDVTERRRMEDETIRAQKLESLGVLAGGLAHDFNNLMTVVLGHVSLIEDSPELGGSERDSLSRVREATEQARHLTSQLLTFARGGAPVTELTDLGALVRKVGRLAFSGGTSDLVLDLPDDLAHAEVDAGQIEQVLSNLFINAQQAMPRGGRVRVTARNGEHQGQPVVRISVRDQGAGVPEEIRDQIFEPYFSTKSTGTGLGLTISYSVLKRHGGDIELDWAEDGGSIFNVILPASPDKVLPAEPRATADDVPLPGHGLRILVMDDEDAIRELTVRMLDRLGHHCTAVANGEAAIEALREARSRGERFEVTILDLTVVGGMGGLEALAELRRLDPELQAVVSSGYSNDPVMSDHLAHGFQATLRKPYDGKTLDQVLKEITEGGRS